MTSRLVRAAVWVVRAYQLLLRPLLPPACRFVPSCSEYCCEVLIAHGVLRGGWWTVKRIARCHPWHPGGFDPPPLPRAMPMERSGG